MKDQAADRQHGAAVSNSFARAESLWLLDCCPAWGAEQTLPRAFRKHFLAEYSQLPVPPLECQHGALLPQGFEQEKANGQTLRERYINVRLI